MKNKIAIISAPFYEEINKGLLAGAVSSLEAAGFLHDTFEVLGALELPLACQQLAKSGNYDALIVLGCVIRGETAHFDYVCEHSNSGLMRVSLEQEIPIGNAVLTVENRAQAEARADVSESKSKMNKGKEAAEAAISLLKLIKAI